MKFSKNAKLNNALCGIYEQLKDFDTDAETGKSNGAIITYYNEFKNDKDATPDYNIAQYGNLLCYFHQLYNFYRNCGYKTTDKFSTEKIWAIYCRQVGYIVRNYFIK